MSKELPASDLKFWVVSKCVDVNGCVCSVLVITLVGEKDVKKSMRVDNKVVNESKINDQKCKYSLNKTSMWNKSLDSFC